MATPKLKRSELGRVGYPGKIIGDDGKVGVEAISALVGYLKGLANKFNIEGVSLGDDTNLSQAGNLDAVRLELRWTAAGEKQIDHPLGRTPVGYIVVLKDQHGDLKASNFGGWNKQTIWLTNDYAGDVLYSIIIF